MATSIRSSLLPQCSACVRSYAFGGAREAGIGAAGFGQQLRGKKQLTKPPTTMPVRLLKDVKTFGRKGSIVPISQGKMRNNWFPQRIAAYIPEHERRTLKISGTAFERDFNFGVDVEEVEEVEEEDYSHVRRAAPSVEKLTPERSFQLFEIFVPKKLDFYRQPMPEEEPESAKESVSRGAAEDFLAMRKARDAQAKQSAAKPIFGSVSISDVLGAVRLALETNMESARVTLTEEDIKFVSEDAEIVQSGRVKHLGEYTIDVLLKGAEATSRRVVRVNAQEA